MNKKNSPLIHWTPMRLGYRSLTETEYHKVASGCFWQKLLSTHHFLLIFANTSFFSHLLYNKIEGLNYCAKPQKAISLYSSITNIII